MSSLTFDQLAPTFPAGEASPQDHAEAIVARSNSSFTFGMRILKRERREAMFAVYAFARTIDDIADGDWPADEKRRLLDAWRAEIDRLYHGAPDGPISRALIAPIDSFDLPKDEFLLMIDGMEMDANGPVRAPSLETLMAYTRRVAGTVGMLSVRIFGAEDKPIRDRFALDLADAFQLTNILRDVEEDAAIGRLYLPCENLQNHGVDFTTPSVAAGDPGMEKVCADIGAIARARFTAATEALRSLDRRPLRPALMMMGVYDSYLKQMEAADWSRSVIPLKMSKLAKLMRGLDYAFLRRYR
ncbi:MAG: presqualene diphosphate synthase HpnD [Pseudomonadota bacterium]